MEEWEGREEQTRESQRDLSLQKVDRGGKGKDGITLKLAELLEDNVSDVEAGGMES